MRTIRTRKKSQMEILGLLIIVILFSLGLLFTIRFMATRGRSTVQETFETKELAANMLAAIISATSEGCRGADMTDLVRDCSAYPSIDCDDDGSVYRAYPLPGGGTVDIADSCAIVQADVYTILNQTLTVWKQRYLFSVTRGDEKIFEDITYGNCRIDDVGDSEKATIPSSDLGDLTILLKLCT